MRPIVMFNRISADGYFSGPNGELDWAVPEDQIDQDAVARLPEGDTILFGRRTYQAFESFWPHVLEHSDTAPDPHSQGRHSPALRAMAEWINQATKLVFSTTLEKTRWHNTRVLRRFDAREVEALKRGPGKGIMLFGSGSVASLLVQHGLVDEYQFVVSPLLLGQGRTLIHAELQQPRRLELLEAKGYPAGNVLLRYRPAR